jgi:hypothetical protein
VISTPLTFANAFAWSGALLVVRRNTILTKPREKIVENFIQFLVSGIRNLQLMRAELD